MKTVKELKDELFEALKTSQTLEDFRDVIFSDTDGEIFSWATNDLDDSEAPETARDALQEKGIAIVVCSCDKRKNADSIPNVANREARFPILVLTNCMTENAPDPQDTVDFVECAIAEIRRDPLKQAWFLDESNQYGRDPNNYVVFATHKYIVG